MKPIRFGPMKGQLFFLAAVSLLGLLTITEKQLVYGAMFLFGMILLKKLKKLPASHLMLMTGCYFLFIAAGYFDSVQFETEFTGREKSFLIFLMVKSKWTATWFLLMLKPCPPMKSLR
ncbi:hypothetical protein [Bacillus sp. ISL-39]|uniref:hypothetical protein n=1 Tax=Bacillus sp. ISL-39 TaxID=2819124 RepID=UPI001BEA55CC|nr:hypothetical protein [Bacillus sp. ISL-39]MBT2636473.1 hypothetical protein [Bacillus sp. ISL-39]